MTITFEVTLSAEQVLLAWDAVTLALSKWPDTIPTGSLDGLERWARQHAGDGSTLTITSAYNFEPTDDAQRLRILALEELSLLAVPQIRAHFSEDATGVVR